MKKIVTILQPFDLKQTIFAYEDGNKIDAAQVETDNIANEICKMAKALDITPLQHPIVVETENTITLMSNTYQKEDL